MLEISDHAVEAFCDEFEKIAIAVPPQMMGMPGVMPMAAGAGLGAAALGGMGAGYQDAVPGAAAGVLGGAAGAGLGYMGGQALGQHMGGQMGQQAAQQLAQQQGKTWTGMARNVLAPSLAKGNKAAVRGAAQGAARRVGGIAGAVGLGALGALAAGRAKRKKRTTIMKV